MSEHSLWSASSFARTMTCPGSTAILQLQAEGKAQDALAYDNKPSIYAAEGTVAHNLFADLVNGKPIKPGTYHAEGFDVEIDDDAIDAIKLAHSWLQPYLMPGTEVASEQRLDYSTALGLPDGEAWGTGDVAALRPDGELVVADLKFGRGVSVESEDNPQLMCYALGALALYEPFADINSIRLVILQPRASNTPRETVMTPNMLKHWAERQAVPAVNRVLDARASYISLEDESWWRKYLTPSEDACRWCPLKAVCPALREQVIDAVSTPATADDFDAAPVDHISTALGMVDRVESWASAIRAEAKARLEAGVQVEGYKLVRGKRGPRAWSDAARAEDIMRKSFRLGLDVAYTRKLISPTAAEKLIRSGDISEKQWLRLEALVTQSDGGVHVAPLSDPREPVALDSQDDFT